MEDNMKLVNVLEKDIDYPDLIQLIENGDENTIYITRDQKPIAKIVSCKAAPTLIPRKIGIAKGIIESPENLDEFNDEIAEMFGIN